MWNPMELLSSLYGRFFTNHTGLSYVVVVVLASIIASLVWTVAIANYRAQHPAAPATHPSPPTPSNTTYGSQSPVMPNNSGVVNITYGPRSPIMPNNSGAVNITNEPLEKGSKEAKKGAKGHEAEAKRNRIP